MPKHTQERSPILIAKAINLKFMTQIMKWDKNALVDKG
jgi:hypothetical protein